MPDLPSEPLWFRVRLGPAAERQLSGEFGQERSGSGRPSMPDLLKYWWPEIEVAVNYGWRAGTTIDAYAELPTEVRELPIKQVLSFPPSHLVVARGKEDWPNGELIVIGVSFDWSAWQTWTGEDDFES